MSREDGGFVNRAVINVKCTTKKASKNAVKML